jgi:membrane protease YdiL (CAAX protease family)
MHNTLHSYVSCVKMLSVTEAETMTTTALEAPRPDVREQLLSAAELACAAWIVIGHNALRIFPNEVPILAVIALVSARLMRGGFATLGFVRPASWRRVLLLALGFVVVRWTAGFAIEAVTAHIWPPIAAPKGADQIVGHPMAALAALGIVWTFAAFGEEISYRGFILGRAAQALGGGRAAWIAGVALSGALFGLGHFYKGPAGILDSSVAGLLLGTVYLLSGRCLWTCILAHGLSDTLAVVLSYLGLNS